MKYFNSLIINKSKIKFNIKLINKLIIKLSIINKV